MLIGLHHSNTTIITALNWNTKYVLTACLTQILPQLLTCSRLYRIVVLSNLPISQRSRERGREKERRRKRAQLARVFRAEMKPSQVPLSLAPFHSLPRSLPPSLPPLFSPFLVSVPAETPVHYRKSDSETFSPPVISPRPSLSSARGENSFAVGANIYSLLYTRIRLTTTYQYTHTHTQKRRRVGRLSCTYKAGFIHLCNRQ